MVIQINKGRISALHLTSFNRMLVFNEKRALKVWHKKPQMRGIGSIDSAASLLLDTLQVTFQPKETTNCVRSPRRRKAHSWLSNNLKIFIVDDEKKEKLQASSH